MPMKNPIHPGEILKELYLEPLGLTITEAADKIGVTRKALSELVNGRAGISPLMAMRLSIAFSTTPEVWLNMQSSYDLAQERDNPVLAAVQTIYSGDAGKDEALAGADPT